MPAPSGSTPHYGLPFPLESDVPDIPTWGSELAAAVETVVSARVGVVEMFAAATAPSGAVLCQGQAISRTTYASLFAVIGTTWGVGDGSTTFNVPDLRGRAPIGAGTGSGLTARVAATKYGTETHQIAANELPAHTHGITDPGHGHTFPGGQFVGTNTGSTLWLPTSGSQGVTFTDMNHSTTGVTVNNSTAASAATPTIQPSIGINFIIWAS